MKIQTWKRKCFAVVLVIVFILQDPMVHKAKNIQSRQHIFWEEAVQEDSRSFSAGHIGKFQIQYYPNGGSMPEENPLSYSSGELPITLCPSRREGYNFAGWFTDNRFQNKIQVIAQDQPGDYTLYAKWTKCIDDDYNVQMYSYQNADTVREGQISKKLKNCRYDFMKEVSIPGMPSTREADAAAKKIADTSQCPQGMCLTDDFLLVSTYSAKAGSPGYIHVFWRQTGEHLAALGMNPKSHLGGLAFDGTHVWVCHSNDNTLECIPYSFIVRTAGQKPENVVDCSGQFERFQVSNSPSCITWAEGRLWVATHTRMFNSQVIAYAVTTEGLQQERVYRIPDKVQGIALDEKGNVYLSTSYGRRKSSYLKIYPSVDEMNRKPSYPEIKVEMPPCSEELVLDGGNIYVLFESAGEKYFEGTDGKGSSIAPIDQILLLAKNSVFP